MLMNAWSQLDWSSGSNYATDPLLVLQYANRVRTRSAPFFRQRESKVARLGTLLTAHMNPSIGHRVAFNNPFVSTQVNAVNFVLC